jgi:RNA polymerase sigma-70 factor (ECF subfamily)
MQQLARASDGKVDRLALLEKTFAEARPTLTRICTSIVGDDGDDIVQNSYLAARSRLHQLRDLDAIKPWLVRIAVNGCFAHRRRRERFAALLPSRPPVREESDLDLRVELGRLSNRERTIIVLHYGHGLELKEVGEMLGEKPATVRSILFRARARLRLGLDANE